MSETNVPALYENDGFDPLSPTDQVIIGARLKFIDGKWSADGVELPSGTKLLAFATDTILQRWRGQEAETIRDKPLPDPDELNAAIPKSEWELDLNGEPRPPWAYTFVVYLLDAGTAEKFTFINSTVGAKIAVRQLQDRVASMRMLRDAHMIAEIELTNRPMKTRYGQKLRPHFHILPDGWRQVGRAKTPKLTQASEPTAAEEMGDEIPF
jgi:hypothetical protein